MFNREVKDVFRKRDRVGDVGIEIEAEFHDPVTVETPAGWELHAEGSIRGNGYEFVLRQPCKLDKVDEYLSRIYDKVIDQFPVVADSKNTSVHVHLNCLRMTMKQVVSTVMLYSILEPFIYSIWDEHRKGNLFCLSFEDCTEQADALKALSEGRKLEADHYKYASLNLACVSNRGSIEFRAMHFPCTKEDIHNWITILSEIKVAGMAMEPVDVISRMSEMGVQGLIDEYVPSLKDRYDADLEYQAYENMYPFQDLAYNHFRIVEVTLDNYLNTEGIDSNKSIIDGLQPFTREHLTHIKEALTTDIFVPDEIDNDYMIDMYQHFDRLRNHKIHRNAMRNLREIEVGDLRFDEGEGLV